MNESINLTKILKDCPIGWKFYSSIYGDVTFYKIESDSKIPVKFSYIIKDNSKRYGGVTEQGLSLPYYKGECTFFPSKDQRDWNKFTASWYKKEKFDPKTLKAFDKVLVKNDDDITWVAALFSHIIEFHDEVTGNDYLESITSYCTSSYCIPYNDDTKHLVGTKDEAPDFYKYWED